jgi:hypothetical protein
MIRRRRAAQSAKRLSKKMPDQTAKLRSRFNLVPPRSHKCPTREECWSPLACWPLYLAHALGFSSRRFLVAVLSDRSGSSWVLISFFIKLLRRSWYSRSLIRSPICFFFFIDDPAAREPIANFRWRRPAALAFASKCKCKGYGRSGVGRCTNCGSGPDLQQRIILPSRTARRICTLCQQFA